MVADIRFWCKEIRIRAKEDAAWERIEEEIVAGQRPLTSGYGYYRTMKRNRDERLRRHKERRDAIR
ncbi:MAG: hypothetical protein IJ169_03805 [Paludibacteraceae bacterium]|nr:hypothetical protein [Paludibacteraceae bacterium]